MSEPSSTRGGSGGHLHIPHNDTTRLLSFSPDHKPYCTIDSGEEVTFDNTLAGFHNLTRNTTDADLVEMKLEGLGDLERCMGPIYVIGPVYINDAAPGDVLKVEILELQTGPWGWTAVFPGLGLLKDEIKGPHIKTFDLSHNKVTFKPGITIPQQPFYGTMGVAPAEGDAHPLFPRDDIGGNFDCRYLGVGGTMFLPVNVPGALFSVGDAHYCQGDGEITGTALETTMKSRIRLTVIKHGKKKLDSPHYQTDPERVKDMHSIGGKGEYGVLATASTRDDAVKKAVRGLSAWLQSDKGLTNVEGYMLLSLCGNLKMMHDLGLELFTVSASIPLGIFEDV